MKKKMGILGGLLMAVVVTGYSVAGTYAKYISSFDMADEARVASWNFNDEAQREVDLFQSSYTYGDGNIVVASKDADKVIAPGTSGTYTYKVTGTAETNYKVTANINIVNRIILAEALKETENYEGVRERDDVKPYYNPIRFSVDGKPMDDPTKDWKEANVAVKDESGNVIGYALDLGISDALVYPANMPLTLEGTIDWKWDFTTGTENDVLDTALANAVLNSDLTIKANVGITVEQTQDAPNYEGENTAKTSLTQNNVVFSAGSVNTNDTAIFGYVKENSKEVRLSGTKLTGTLYKTTNDYTNRYMGKAATGYYYALNVKVPENVKHVSIKDTWYGYTNEDGSVHNSEYDVKAGDVLDLILGLKENQTSIDYEFTTTDDKKYTVSIDLKGLKRTARIN